jgi:microcystin-dependent protein
LSENAFLWSVTAADNDDADPAVSWPENMLPGAVNNSARATMSGIARLLKDLNGTIASGGSSNAYTVTSSSGHTTYTNGTLISFRASFTNTAAATLNMNTYGAKKIRVFAVGAEAEIAASQIVSGCTYQFRYDSALDGGNGAFLCLNPSPDPASSLSAGSIKIWPSDTLESGWAWANGQSLVRADYAALFAAIGTTYGAADGTHFNVPDLCGRAPFGSDDMGGIAAKSRITNAECSIVGTTLGASGGAQSIALTTAQLASHTHTASSSSLSASGTTSGASQGHTHLVAGATGTESAGHTHSGTTGTMSNDHTHQGTTDSGGAHTHTGTTATESQSHTHTGTSGTESADHTHGVTAGTQATQVFGGGGTAYIALVSSGGTITSSVKSATHTHTTTTGNASQTHTHTFTSDSDGAHTHTFTSGTSSAGHTHDVTTGTESAAHNHSMSFTSGANSVDHTHTVTVTGTAAAQAVANAGSDATHSNMPPALIVNYAIKT